MPKKNLRPVSMREFQQHATFVQTSTPEWQQQLRSRSGLFQYNDLGDLISPNQTATETPEREEVVPVPDSQERAQPEEEPLRRKPEVFAFDAQLLAEAHRTLLFWSHQDLSLLLLKTCQLKTRSHHANR